MTMECRHHAMHVHVGGSGVLPSIKDGRTARLCPWAWTPRGRWEARRVRARSTAVSVGKHVRGRGRRRGRKEVTAESGGEEGAAMEADVGGVRGGRTRRRPRPSESGRRGQEGWEALAGRGLSRIDLSLFLGLLSSRQSRPGHWGRACPTSRRPSSHCSSRCDRRAPCTPPSRARPRRACRSPRWEPAG